MKNCPKCGAKIETNTRFCIHCMTSLEPKTVIKTNLKFKKRWPYILAAVLVITLVSYIAFQPHIGGKTANEGIVASDPTKPATSVIRPDVSQTNTYPSNVNSQENSVPKNHSSTNENPKQSSSTKSDTSSDKHNISTSKPNITDFLTFAKKTNGRLFIGHSKRTISGAIVIPSEYNDIPVESIGALAFADCTKITSVTIPSSIETISDNAFQNCYGLTTVTFSEGLKEILCGAFVDCKNLKTVVLPDSLKTLGDMTFEGCSNLSSITIPKSITGISYDTFKRCDKLKDVYYRGTEADKEKITIVSGNDALLGATWHYES